MRGRILANQRPRHERQRDAGWSDATWNVILGFIALLGFAIALTQPPNCYDPPGVAPAPTAPVIDVRHLPFYFVDEVEELAPGDSGSPKAFGFDFDDMGSELETCRPAGKGPAQVDWI